MHVSRPFFHSLRQVRNAYRFDWVYIQTPIQKQPVVSSRNNASGNNSDFGYTVDTTFPAQHAEHA